MAARRAYVDAGVIHRVIEHAPTAHWRLLIALARFAGVRVPSEPFSMRWSDIDWDGGKITIHSPKTERMPGKAFRVIPPFPSISGGDRIG